MQPYKGPNTRHTCPACGHRRTFTRYIDTETGECLAYNTGRCNRENNCGYHYSPKQYFADNPGKRHCQPRTFISTLIRSHTGGFEESYKKQQPFKQPVQRAKVFSTIPYKIFRGSLQHYNKNHLAAFLIKRFGYQTAEQALSRYCIGASKHWPGATVFWQVDEPGKVRAGKIMLYNPDTGKRVKEPYNCITWVHTALKLPDFELQQCFFGEHLLRDKASPVAIVESEKTAIIASIYLPKFIWLATGGKNGCKWATHEVAKVLRGRVVVFYPDLNCFDDWSSKVRQLGSIAGFSVTDYLEKRATEADKKQGCDLADYLLRFEKP